MVHLIAGTGGQTFDGRLYRAIDRVARICLGIAGVQLVTLIVIFGWLVFGRYVLNDTPTWVEQLSLILVVWIAFLGAAAGVWYNTHLSVDFIRALFPKPLRSILCWVALIALVGFGLIMAKYGWELASKTWPRRIPMLGFSEGWRAVPMAICGVLTVIFTLAHMVMRTQGYRPEED